MDMIRLLLTGGSIVAMGTAFTNGEYAAAAMCAVLAIAFGWNIVSRAAREKTYDELEARKRASDRYESREYKARGKD
jgi:hypothetical protein